MGVPEAQCGGVRSSCHAAVPMRLLLDGRRFGACKCARPECPAFPIVARGGFVLAVFFSFFAPQRRPRVTPVDSIRLEVKAGTLGGSSLEEEVMTTTLMGKGPTKDNWRKGQLLGEGSFGKVYRGLNTVTGACVVCVLVRLHLLCLVCVSRFCVCACEVAVLTCWIGKGVCGVWCVVCSV